MSGKEKLFVCKNTESFFCKLFKQILMAVLYQLNQNPDLYVWSCVCIF